MKKHMLLIVLFFIATFCYSQEDAWVYFKDKPDSSSYFNNPTEMLSQKALDRRLKQNIDLDITDVPLYKPYKDAIAAVDGITVMAQSKWLNALHIRGTQDAIFNLKNLEFVDHIDFADRTLNHSGRMNAIQQNAIVDKVLETEENFSYGTASRQIQMLNGDVLHQLNFTGKDITIAVLDAGFPAVNTTPPFQRLYDNNLIKGGYNYVNRSEDFYTGGTHGTIVLSTMGGYVENQLAGTAPDASYYLFVTEDPTSENPVEESYWVEAAEAADSLGVDVINTSLGYFNYDNPRYSYSYENMDGKTAFISRGADIAVSKGIFCVVSAGNSGNTTNPHIGAPADAYDVLTVGAVDTNENYVGFSSIGPSYDNRVKPDVMAIGYLAAIANTNGEITAASGTSFSSPITAGLVACLWQALPDKTNTELRQLIKESADRYTSPTAQYGFGIPDFNVAMQNGMNLTNDKFIIYPNPSNDIVNLLFPKNTPNTTVTIFNNLGQKIMEEKVMLDNPLFSIKNLATGIYSYKLEGSGKNQKGRLIKN
ncbi:S8 family serine peptidase [Flavobacterium sp. NRK1]|uniref:S8 family peptidase n=1 Tax=Flavobacterium sp. NRK1 TaxID=2954929 RepID=UPI002092A6FB|nr:S8 family serine peptidase [Flavobacterium sp. NRK1]MCO6149630.1 S8 family serine peptidase [Flavobacterium sp. NRK1]